MKNIVILGDGMGDYPIPELGNRTPLQVAKKPTIDYLSENGELGMVSTIPEGMAPGSDTANLSVMGYDPRKYYTGRSPLEAVSMGISMQDTDISFRCNVVTLSQSEPYWEKTILDHSADEITTEEARELILAIQKEFGNDILKFYPGISYRHALIWSNGSVDVNLTPPHDILGKCINNYRPHGDFSDEIAKMMEKSYAILSKHPVNIKRMERGLKPANSIWIWGQGKKPALDSFEEKYGIKGAMISAVDLLKGIAIAAGMESIDVAGANGTLHTNYEGKVEACLEALDRGKDFAYVHLEAPDECGHRGEVENKIKAIELIDERVVKPILEGLTKRNIDFRILILPDHPTPIALRTHTSDSVPYLLYDSKGSIKSGLVYNEENGKLTGRNFDNGYKLMDYFLNRQGE